jgi:hypothetical protein
METDYSEGFDLTVIVKKSLEVSKNFKPPNYKRMNINRLVFPTAKAPRGRLSPILAYPANFSVSAIHS